MILTGAAKDPPQDRSVVSELSGDASEKDSISVPRGVSPVIDGTITTEEWRGARREFFSDGSELFLLLFEDELYLGIRAYTAGMIAGNVFIESGEAISIFHASAALGTAVYRKDGEDWRLDRDFSWRCRRTDDSEEARAERNAFFQEENWIASNSRMGAPHELEYRIRVSSAPFRLAAHFLRASDPTIKVPWPVDLDDDTIKPTPGGLPPTLWFSPGKWATIGAAQTDFPVLDGPYLSQKRPGPTPEIFAPGILSLGFHEHNIAISPDGREIFFVAASSDFSRYLIMTTRLRNGAWTMPEVAPFTGGRNDGAPAFSPDGKRLYFSSRRPRTAGGTSAEDFDIWYVERRGDSWTDPLNLGSPVNTGQNEANPSVMSDGTIVFQRIEKLGTLNWDLYRSSPRNGVYGPPEKLPAPINTEANEAGPFIAADGSYILFQSNRPGGYGIMDIYIAYRTEGGGWSEPVNLGDKINSSFSDWGPVVSPDGKYLFFSSFRSILPLSAKSQDYLEYMKSRLGTSVPGKGTLYWMEAKIIDGLKPKDKILKPLLDEERPGSG
jgi:Tol biopolymer transport system component